MHISLWVCKGQRDSGNFPKCIRLEKSYRKAPEIRISLRKDHLPRMARPMPSYSCLQAPTRHALWRLHLNYELQGRGRKGTSVEPNVDTQGSRGMSSSMDTAVTGSWCFVFHWTVKLKTLFWKKAQRQPRWLPSPPVSNLALHYILGL